METLVKVATIHRNFTSSSGKFKKYVKREVLSLNFFQNRKVQQIIETANPLNIEDSIIMILYPG